MAIFITQPSIYQDFKKTSSPYRSQTVALGLCILIETIGRCTPFRIYSACVRKIFFKNLLTQYIKIALIKMTI